MKPQLRFEEQEMRVADLGVESCVPDLSGEMILQNQLKFTLDEDDEIYEGYGRRSNAYPYRKYDSYTRKLSKKMVRTAVLENRQLSAVFLPEYGGRLWSLTDKATGHNLLYTNDVIRFSNLAVRNAWFSGGVEWNIGVIGHSPLTTEPLYTARTEDAHGNPVLRMYEFERIRKVSYQMDFWLSEDDPYLNCRMRIVNDNDDVVPMYWWSNMAVPEYEGGRIVVPASSAYTLKDFNVFKVNIPFVNTVDITDYTRIPKSVDYFFDIETEEPKYIANLGQDGYGLLQMSTKRLRGRKLFSWGNQEASDRWQEFLTDQAGRYIEIQAGLGKTQYGCLPMPPHRAWEWVERYGAARMEPSLMKESHEARREALTKQLRQARAFEEMECILRETKEMAKKSGEVVFAGSGYGALECGGMETRGGEAAECGGMETSGGEAVECSGAETCGGEAVECSGAETCGGEAVECGDRAYINTGTRKQGGRCLSGHLQFIVTDPGLKGWKSFLETGILDCPSVEERPAAFFDDEKSFRLLKRTTQKENKENWYAHYLLAVRYYLKNSFGHARSEFKKSLELEVNPWALHGMACLGLSQKERAEDVEALIEQGMNMRRKDCSYLKEGFKILYLCGSYDALIHFYEGLDEEERAISRLKFYYIAAWHKLGHDREAYEMLEQDGGLELEDIREGEDSIMELWTELHQSLYGTKGNAPHKYKFHAFE